MILKDIAKLGVVAKWGTIDGYRVYGVVAL